MESASEIIEQNPHPAFDKIKSNGYRLEFLRQKEADFFEDLIVGAMRGADRVAAATFTHDLGMGGAGSCLYCQNVDVHPEHRRKGLANAIYVFAEKFFGKPLINFWASDEKQTELAEALWAQPNRPFGR